MNSKKYFLLMLVVFFALLVSGCSDERVQKHAEFLETYMADVQAALPGGKLDKNTDAYKKLAENNNASSLGDFMGHGDIVSYDIPKEIKVEDESRGTKSATMITVIFNDKTTNDFLISLTETKGKIHVQQVLGMNELRAFANGELERD